MHASLAAFMHYYFWGLTPQLVAVIGFFTAPAVIGGIFLAPRVSRRFDKKRVMMGVFFVSIFVGVIPPILRLTGVLPLGSPLVLPVLIVDAFVASGLAFMGHVIVGSMVADVTEDAAVRTGARSEGLLFATNGLLPKVTSGVGTLVGNLMLQAVHVPVGARAHAAALATPQMMQQLVLMSLPLGAALHIVAVSVLAFYRIDRSSHEANLEALRLADALGGPAVPLPTQPAFPTLPVA